MLGGRNDVFYQFKEQLFATTKIFKHEPAGILVFANTNVPERESPG